MGGHVVAVWLYLMYVCTLYGYSYKGKVITNQTLPHSFCQWTKSMYMYIFVALCIYEYAKNVPIYILSTVTGPESRFFFHLPLYIK